jgi:hypothetical protein
MNRFYILREIYVHVLPFYGYVLFKAYNHVNLGRTTFWLVKHLPDEDLSWLLKTKQCTMVVSFYM